MSDTFDGFDPPIENWSKLPNALIDALPMITSEAEAKVILYILRHTWGYHDENKRISHDEFSGGRKRKDGSRIDGGTGLSENAIKDGLRRAVSHGFIEIDIDPKDRARVRHYYKLKMRRVSEVDTPNVGGQSLIPRVSEFDTLASEFDTRSEKETLENKHEKEPDAPRQRDPLFDAISQVCAIDPKVKGNGAKIGKAKAALLASNPPYTPDEILRFLDWWNSDEWRKRRGPPSLWNLIEKIGIVRLNGNGSKSNATYQSSVQEYSQADIESADRINKQRAEERAAGRVSM